MNGATTDVRAAGRAARWFYVWMAGTCMAIAVLGFMPTYFMPMTQGLSVGPSIVHLHGLLFFGWTLFFFSQTLLVAQGKTLAHRDWGMLGIALATAMVLSVFVTVGVRINGYVSPELAAGMRSFAWVQVSGMLFFGTVVALAIMHVRKPEIHKRLMLLGAISLLDAPIARWFMMAMGGPPPLVNGESPPPPVFVSVPPALVADVLIVAAIVFDWRTRGRPHPVWLIGGAVLLALQLTRIPISGLPAWDSFARGLAALGG